MSSSWRPTAEDAKIARIVAGDVKLRVPGASTYRGRYAAALLGIWIGRSKKPDATGGYVRRCAEHAVVDLLRELGGGAKPKREVGRPTRWEAANPPERIVPLSPQAEEGWRESALEYVLREYGTPDSPGRAHHRRSSGRWGPAGPSGHGPDDYETADDSE